MVARTPRKRMYRTMQGRMIDIEKLRSANESVRAVGNMGVNAKGDVLGKGGAVVTPEAQIMNKYYEKPRGMVDDTPARLKPKPVSKITPVAKPQAQPMQVKKTVAQKKTSTKATKKTTVAKKGIDAALDGLE